MRRSTPSHLVRASLLCLLTSLSIASLSGCGTLQSKQSTGLEARPVVDPSLLEPTRPLPELHERTS